MSATKFYPLSANRAVALCAAIPAEMAMTISLNQLGKRYQQHWVFKGITYVFEAGKQYAVLGANGSGKSTLLRIIAGMQHGNRGKLQYRHNDKEIAADAIFNHVSYCAPGMDLIEEMSLSELLHFHFTFKKIRQGFTVAGIIEAMGMHAVRDKFIHEFSSGMKQRVKLAQAFFTETPMLLLDEPCSNLDLQGVGMYQHWLQQYTSGRLVIIASNDEREYEGVADTISIQDYQ
ncbi:MAG: ABC transporter ATP-binding protein [Sphingobacteriales bacterium]|nr:MAG: ABC transporter ATP-binding protein [Sphingobacteriales bacterium]